MSVDLHRRGAVVAINLNRPDKLNAMTDAMWAELEGHLLSIDTGGRDRVLVLSGAGGAFCAGSDVDGLLDDPESLADRIEVSNRCVLAMRDMPIPTIAQVDGIAAGSGLNLALACDFVHASERARFAQLFIRIGLSLDSGASWLLPRLIGERRARELCLLGDTLDAQTAAAWGMVTATHPAEELDAVVVALADRLASLSPDAMAGTKKMLNLSWQHDLSEALDAETQNQLQIIRTEVAQDRIRTFVARSSRAEVGE